MKNKFLKLTAFLLLFALYLLPPTTATAQPTDGVSVTVNGQQAQRHGNAFSMLSACGQQQAVIQVTAGSPATIKINGVTQNPRTVNLTVYGNNIINITVTPQGGSAQSYTLTINKPIPFGQIMVTRWGKTLAVNNNPANNGGFTFSSYKWFRNGELISTDGYILIDININSADIYYAEMVDTNVAGIIRSCPGYISEAYAPQ